MICSSMRGARRAATIKKTTQKTVETQTQEISKIATLQFAAFGVPLAAFEP